MSLKIPRIVMIPIKNEYIGFLSEIEKMEAVSIKIPPKHISKYSDSGLKIRIYKN